MKLIRYGLAAALALAVGITVPAFAQHDHGDDRGKDKDRHERREVRDRHEEHERHYGRISDDHWHSHFGREHRFVIARPVIVEGRPRFQYGGYWFVIGRPLPPGWRYSDEVYVDYIDGGYYMCSPVHPGVHISINIL